MVSLKGKPFSSSDIIESGLRRLARKLSGVQYAMICAKHKTESRRSSDLGDGQGDPEVTPETDYSKFVKWVAGIATIADGVLHLDAELLALFGAYDIDWKSPPQNSGPS